MTTKNLEYYFDYIVKAQTEYESLEKANENQSIDRHHHLKQKLLFAEEFKRMSIELNSYALTTTSDCIGNLLMISLSYSIMRKKIADENF